MTDSSTRVPDGRLRSGLRRAAALIVVVLAVSVLASCSRAGADAVALRGSTTTDGSGAV
ncbi:MAG: hypothetical protein HY830_01940, partial [Actinobacteria bacterium]|nr:hypothetical protein [Actinomycetota bacterium]